MAKPQCRRCKSVEAVALGLQYCTIGPAGTQTRLEVPEAGVLGHRWYVGEVGYDGSEEMIRGKVKQGDGKLAHFVGDATKQHPHPFRLWDLKVPTTPTNSQTQGFQVPYVGAYCSRPFPCWGIRSVSMFP